MGVSEPDVDEMVQEAAHKLERLGAEVTTTQLPWHRNGMAVFMGIGVEGVTTMVAKGSGVGTNWKGYYTSSLIEAYARGMRTRPNDLSPTTKLMFLLGQYMPDNYYGRYYAKAQNLARSLMESYDNANESAPAGHAFEQLSE